MFTLAPEEYKVGIVVHYYLLNINANQQIFDENNYEWLLLIVHQEFFQFLKTFLYKESMVEEKVDWLI